MNDETNVYDEAAGRVVELANRLADADPNADLWDIADGLLAGAVHYWLYSRQPCGEDGCEDCAPLATAELRLKELRQLLEEFARTSEYFHSPTDLDVGHA